MRRCALVVGVVMVCLVGGPVWAEEVGEPEEELAASGEERAAEFARQARVAYSAGRYDEAADLLERAFAHDTNLVYMYNRVLALVGAQRFEDAERVLDVYGDVLRDDERFDDIDEIAEGVREGREAALAAESGEEVEEESQVEPVEAPPEVESGPDVLALSLMGGGGAVLGTGILLSSGVLIGDRIERLENPDVVGAYEGSEFARDDDLRALRSHQVLSAVLLAAGAGAVGAGAFLYVRGSGDREGAVSVEFEAGPGSAGAVVRGRF